MDSALRVRRYRGLCACEHGHECGYECGYEHEYRYERPDGHEHPYPAYAYASAYAYAYAYAYASSASRHPRTPCPGRHAGRSLPRRGEPRQRRLCRCRRLLRDLGLITSSLARELSATGGISIRKFYARRALRLLPASTLVVVATLVGAWLFLPTVRLTEYAGDALSSALYAVNFRLALSGTDYLAQGSPPSPFQHFWSLAVEEQFYLLWPLLLLLTWKVARRRWLSAAVLAALCLTSLGLSVYVTEASAPWAYFGLHTRGWELGVGALLAMSVTRLERLPATLSAAMTWVGLGCVVLSAVRFDGGHTVSRVRRAPAGPRGRARTGRRLLARPARRPAAARAAARDLARRAVVQLVSVALAAPRHRAEGTGQASGPTGPRRGRPGCRSSTPGPGSAPVRGRVPWSWGTRSSTATTATWPRATRRRSLPYSTTACPRRRARSGARDGS